MNRYILEVDDIMEVFKEETSPIHAMVRLNEYSLTWIISKLYRNTKGRPLQLLPFQSVMMDVLWNKKYPLILACRGAGKCSAGNSLQQLSNGMYRFDELISKDSIEMTPLPVDMQAMGEDGLKSIAYGWNNGVRNTKKICTRFGFEIENTLNHPLRIIDVHGNITWRDTSDIRVGDIIPVIRSEYNFGIKDNMTEDQGWFLGATIGDGICGEETYLGFTNIDNDIINNWRRIGEQWSGELVVRRPSAKIGYFINSRDFRSLLYKKFNIEYCTSHHKQIPLSVRTSTKKVVAAFLSGLYDTDGGMTKRGIEYSTTSEELSRQVQVSLLAFGILSKRRKKIVRLNGKNFRAFIILITGSDNCKLFRDKIGFRCKRKQKALCKICMRLTNTNVDIIPSVMVESKILDLISKYKQSNHYISYGHDYSYTRTILSPCRIKQYGMTYDRLKKILDITIGLKDSDEWCYLNDIYEKHYFFDFVFDVEDGRCRTYDIHIPDDHTFISNGFISHNSFLLAVYALTRALLCPGSEIIIVGAGLRQSMKVFSYIVKLYNQSPIMQEALKPYGGPRIVTTGPYINVGHLSKIIALPIGDGEKIRGQRATHILCVDGSTIIETENGLVRIKESFDNDIDCNIYTGNCFERPKYFLKTQPTDAYRIKTMMGYEIICSDAHRIQTIDGWKNVLELKSGDKIPFKNQFVFPEKDYIEYEDVILDEDLAFLLGIIVSEGSVNNKYSIAVTNTDRTVIDAVDNIMNKLGIEHQIYECPAYVDNRGWKCKKGWEIKCCNLKFRNKLLELGLERKTARHKIIPSAILYSNKNVIISFLRGLFIGDGSAFLYKDKKRDNNFGIAYYTGSEQLSIDLQILLHKFGIFCSRSSRKSNLSDHLQYQLRFYGRNTHAIYNLLKIDKWISIYEQSYKNGKFIKPYDSLPIISIEKLNGKHVLYDYTLPINKSFIGNCFINHNCDEFATIPEGVFEHVIKPFASVHADPEERVRVEEFCERIRGLGADDELVKKILSMQGYGNQVVLSGTASYEFNHFYRYYESYRMIIKSSGNARIIQKALEKRSRAAAGQFSTMSREEVETLASGWKNYAVYQLPFAGMPKGFLDAENVTNDKATFSRSRFGMEYDCRFAKDSDGFIKRSLIDDATPADHTSFSVELYGDPAYDYVLGLDPARHNDNFGSVVMKLVPGGAQVVYSTAWSGKDTPTSVRNIREIMERFNIVRIAMDQGGGGDAVADTLRLKELCQEDELPIYVIKEQLESKTLLGEQGLFIIDLVKWSSGWISTAAHGLKGDIEHMRVLFPSMPLVTESPFKKSTIQAAYQYMPRIVEQYASRVLKHQRKPTEQECKMLDDIVFGKEDDDFEKIEEGIWDHIQAMIDETCTIERTVTPNGVERFELPALLEQPEGLDVRRRDRFSALVLASHAARTYRTIKRSQKPLKTGGSPRSILAGKTRGRRKITRRGSVTY